jgi:hypothetical protein
MPIQPLSGSRNEISVTDPISPALERVKQILFRPFDLGKWFTIGFCAWLAMLGEGGGGGGFNGNYGGGNHPSNPGSGYVGESLRHGFNQAGHSILDNPFWIVPALVLAVMFAVDFVVPIMFLRGGRWLEAWKEFHGLLWEHPGQFVLYILFQIVLAMASGVITLGAILITCCIAGCLVVIPYIGTVVLLPVLVFKRSYSARFLAQFGPHYDVFPPAPPV